MNPFLHRKKSTQKFEIIKHFTIITDNINFIKCVVLCVCVVITLIAVLC